MEILECEDERGASTFADWFDTLDARAAAKVTVALARLASGNRSHVKGVGTGVLELTIDFGPGYRVYFGQDGEELGILLGGGTKKRQERDIEAAQKRWHNYKGRKKRMG